MTAQLISADHGRDTGNPYERALWIVTGVLILGSVLAMAWAQETYSAHSGGWTEQPSADVRIAQVASFIAPSALTGGIVSACMALAIRAMTFSPPATDARVVSASGAEPVLERESAAPVPVGIEKNRIASAGPSDHTLYMRPESDK